MPTGTMEYVAPITGVRFDPIEITSSRASIENIVLEVENDERLKITFHLIDVFTEADATAIATEILPSIIDRLAFYRNIPVGEPYLANFTLPKGASGKAFSVMSSIRVSDSAHAVLTLGEDTRRELARQLEAPYAHHYLYSLYRFAIGQSDAVARFMFLYNLLLQINNDNQKEVDRFIVAESPTVPLSPSPRLKGVNETIFTRLRNEVGHRRAGTTPEQTSREIAANVVGLQTLTRKAITGAVSSSP